LSRDVKPARCVECGRLIPEEEASWRVCSMCGDSICLEHTYYMRVKRSGLYDTYFDVVRVCKRCKI
jgi:uncharacterized UBP type Zn finger protein